MPHYQRFIFESVELVPSTGRIELNYSLDGEVHFQEVVTLPKNLPLTSDHPDLKAALFALHLAGGASYYKTYCPPVIEVKSGQLSKAQADFWNTLYTHGLGEFFYRNQLDFRGLINFPVDANPADSKTRPPKNKEALPQRILTAFGGGKDSMVTAELLRQRGIDQTLFRLRGHRLITELASSTELPLLELDRTLSPELFRLNEAGALNGHVPITAYISCLSIVVALLCGYTAVAFSNERSSSYGNVDYLGMAVNHQWSKSLEAERNLRSYMSQWVATDVSYLNLLRPLSELHIAKLFAGYPKYFPLATSCNRNWLLVAHDEHAGHWCGHCPKCAFSFALLAAWLPADVVIKIFGHNLFEDPLLLPLYRQLLGIEGFKPFECVGTPEETAAAFYLARDKPELAQTVIMKEFTKKVAPGLKNPTAIIKQLLTPDLGSADPLSATLLGLQPLEQGKVI